MEENAIPGSTSVSPAADQARRRRERREAKIQAGGSARLGRILGDKSFRAEAEGQSSSMRLAPWDE